MVPRDDDALFVVLGDQLFPPEHLADSGCGVVYMAEDWGLCTEVRHHQQKIVLFLAAMRHHADSLRDNGYAVHYQELEVVEPQRYEDRLEAVVRSLGVSRLVHFEIEDKPMEQRLITFAKRQGLEREVLSSPGFLCSRDRFADFAQSGKRLRMAAFYRRERLRQDILVDGNGAPAGGRWSFDEENRKKLPKHVNPPEVPAADSSEHVRDVVGIVQEHFSGHPGNAADFAWPVTRQAALAWLDDFVKERLAGFGPYEDAISTRSDTVFHSVLSPLINTGLLTPGEIVHRALRFGEQNSLPLQSIEGFTRQVIGWREFVRGVYRNYSDEQASRNFWNHERELTDHWYTGDTGIPILDGTIHTVLRRGWTHHIPRLMVLGNLMTLCEIRPRAAHRWFMEMYVDSAYWVMGPNVYGMGLFSDGGLFATKPYICGSNYLLKMSDYPRGEWCDVVDGLYWRFIDRHRDFFQGNPRLALMPRALDRLDSTRRKRIFAAAGGFLQRVTQ